MIDSLSYKLASSNRRRRVFPAGILSGTVFFFLFFFFPSAVCSLIAPTAVRNDVQSESLQGDLNPGLCCSFIA